MQYPVEDFPIGALNLVLDRVNSTVAASSTETHGSPLLPHFATRMDFWDAFASAPSGNESVAVVVLAQTVFGGHASTKPNVAAAAAQFRIRRSLRDVIDSNDELPVVAEKVFGCLTAVSSSEQLLGEGDARPHWYSDWIEANSRYRYLPALARAALVLDTWRHYAMNGAFAHLGPLIAAAYIKACQGTPLLPVLQVGLKAVSRLRYTSVDQTARVVALLQVIERAALFELKEHRALVPAVKARSVHIGHRRSNSRLKRLLELAMECPVLSVATVRGSLGVSSVGARDLIRDLQLKETTGRKRDCLWSMC